MDENVKNIGYGILGRLIDFGMGYLTAPRKHSSEKRIEQIEKTLQSLPSQSEESSVAVATSPPSQNPAPVSSNPGVATAVEPAKSAMPEGTACVSCCSEHFSTCSGLISDEAMRMVKREGINDEIVRRILRCSDQLNAMEREDLSVEKMAYLPDWEKQIAIYAQNEGAKVRHKLDNIRNADDLENVALEIKQARDKIGTEWHKGRLAQMGPGEKQSIHERAEAVRAKLGKAGEPEISLEEAKKEAQEEVTKRIEESYKKEA